MSDYGHHPTEIKATLKALKDQNPARPILEVFQPHQYSRTYELLEDFKTCFYDCDTLIIPNIYESRDSKEDKQKINTQKLLDNIKHHEKIN
jgi:UDP-N-acetylmuramate--alanine ligase